MATVLDFKPRCGNHKTRPAAGQGIAKAWDPVDSGAFEVLSFPWRRSGGGMERTEWIQFIIRLSFGRHAFSREFFEGVAILREIESWVREHHVLLLPYFDEYGFPRFPSGTVTVSFLAKDEAEKAMAFRVLVNRLGLSSTLETVRLVNFPEPRITPPRAVPYF